MTTHEKSDLVVMFEDGPSSDKCWCHCPDGPCEHIWDGPVIYRDEGRTGSVTCSRCGKAQIDHDIWVLP